MRRLLFCGDGHGALSVAKGLLKSGYVCDVLSNDDDVNRLFEKAGGNKANSISDWIRSSDDIVISAAYKPLVLKSDIERAHIINVHYALFPKYRGLHSIVWAMLNGETHVGLTIHYMDELLDAGPIIYQEKIEVGEKTSWELMMFIDQRAGEVIGPVVTDLINNKVKAIEQNHEEALFVGKRNRKDCEIIWKEWDAKFFQRALKALVVPYPRPYFLYKDKEYEIGKAEVVHRYYKEIPGHVVYRDNESVWIKLTDGLLRVKTLWSNGIEMPAKEVLKFTGARLDR